MSKPVKIFELKMEDWMKGLSLQSSIAVGGLFSSSSNFDPFAISGMMSPSLASAVASDSSITQTPRILTQWTRSGVSKILAHSQAKLYEVLDGSPYTTLDKTSEIVVTNGVRGAVIYKNKYVYALDNNVRASTLASSDIEIFSGVGSDGIYHPLVVGADKNLYMGDYSAINKITSVAGTAGNTASIVTLEEGMYVRHMVNDGRYLVILADNNPTGDYNIMGGSPTIPTPQAGNYRCQILYWDMVKSTFDQIFEFNDSYLIGGVYLDGGIYVFSGNGIYVTNIATFPKQIFSFKIASTITEKPQNSWQITRNKNSIYWCGQSNGSIYAYGSLFPGMKKIFYQPFNASYTPSAITNNGTNFYIGTSGTDNFLRITGTGSTYNTASIATASISLPQSYVFDHAKVVMKNVLSSGVSVNLNINTQASSKVVTDTNTKTFAQIGAKQTIVFDRTNAGSGLDVQSFEDFTLSLSANAPVTKVEVWATPLDPRMEQE